MTSDRGPSTSSSKEHRAHALAIVCSYGRLASNLTVFDKLVYEQQKTDMVKITYDCDENVQSDKPFVNRRLEQRASAELGPSVSFVAESTHVSSVSARHCTTALRSTI